jgi:Na+/melibiose symporter-like transporter
MSGATAVAAPEPGAATAPSGAAGRRLPRRVLAAYAAPAFAQALIHGPAATIIQGIYGKHFGVSLAAIATVLLIARIFDAVTDPIIGYLSDRFATRWGRRKPWLVCGSLVAVVACWFLYNPGGPVSVGYFLFWFLMAYLGWTISEIPYRAWMAEITQDYDERTRLATWRTFALYAGITAFYGMPYLPLFETTEFTPETLRATAIFAAIALPTMAIIAVTLVPSGAESRAGPTPRLRDAWPAIVRNKPFLLLTLIFMVGGLGGGMAYGMLFFFVDGYLKLGASLGLVFMLGAPVGALSMPFWGAVARRIGKQKTWAVSYLLSGTVMLCHLLIPVGPAGQPWLIACFVGLFVVSPAGAIITAAMLADVVDYGRWKFRVDYAGSYFALQTMMEKAVAGVGAAVGLAIAAAFGFDPTLAEQSPSGTFGLLLAMPLLPALMTLLTLPFIWRFPIDERRQRLIVRRLEQRAARERRPPSG